MNRPIKNVSVVIPCLNAYPFIADAIESILKQSFQNFEIIIVDGGSNKETLELIEKYIKMDNRIRIVNQDKGFIGEAANIGIEASKYDWIARLDGDDISYPERLKKEIEFLNKTPDAALVSTNYEFINFKGDKIGVTKKLKLQNPPLFNPLVDPNIPHQSILVSKKAVMDIGGYRDFKQGEDYDLFLRLSDKYKLYHIEDVLTAIRILNSGLTLSGFELQRKLWMYAKDDTLRRRRNIERLNFEDWTRINEEHINKKINQWKAEKEIRKAGLHLMSRKYVSAFISLLKAFIFKPGTAIKKVLSYKIK